ncbi:MAG: hypothetical protein ABWX93_10865 [Pseudoxanthomonas sp.]
MSFPGALFAGPFFASMLLAGTLPARTFFVVAGACLFKTFLPTTVLEGDLAAIFFGFRTAFMQHMALFCWQCAIVASTVTTTLLRGRKTARIFMHRSARDC